MNRIKVVIYILIISLFILDSKTTISGMHEGIQLCLQSAIPALFPFLVFTPIVNSQLPDFIIHLIKPIGKLCGIPRGGESLFLLGLLSGYPNGARLIAESWTRKQLNKQDALRMLGFCNNAGPAFLFGVCGAILPSKAVWALFAIHAVSAIITGILLPNKSKNRIQLQSDKPITVTSAIQPAIKVMAQICAWILLFRVLQAFLKKYIAFLLESEIINPLLGMLEVTSGILSVDPQSPAGFKFICIAVFLACGGLCVAAQTISVTKQLGTGYYFPGKILQSAISLLLSCFMQYTLFDKNQCIPVPWGIIVITLFIIIFLLLYLYRKKTVAISNIMMYNAVRIKK